METRRDFLRLSALAALAALGTPGSVHAATGRNASIVGIVDVARALAEDSLVGSLTLFDNNARFGSRGLGTSRLASVVEAGSPVLWISNALEVETFADILDISGPAARLTGARCVSEYDGALTYWTGNVPADARGEHAYDLVININGRPMTLAGALTLSVIEGGAR